ncbi:MAG: hypothetical protein H6510_08740 [Acidobacteria bacterium]|nr:hypothetical protein [Acidobacteriota bacterium]MCB9397889.1 hypothetical protein [Acidobacteriota bacterium]
MRKLVPKIILEGTRLTGKTEVAFALNEHPRFVGPRRYRYHSPVISAEWGSFTNTPWGRGLINFEPHEAERALETYRTWLKLFQLQPYCSWIVDRFHLSTQMVQWRTHQTRYDFSWLEKGLAQLNFRLVVLHRSHESFAKAREERLRVSANPSQYDDLHVFFQEQDLILELAKHSNLMRMELDISHLNTAAVVESIVDWMDQTGGLFLSSEFESIPSPKEF